MDAHIPETDPPRSGWARFLHRPDGLVAQTRWLFTMFALASMLLSAPSVAGAPGLLAGSVGIAAYGGLAVVWIARYHTGRAPIAVSVLEAGLIFATSVTAPDPAAIFVYLFATLWLRALYGSTREIFLHTAFVAVAVIGAMSTWTLLAGRVGPPSTPVGGMINGIPVLFLTVAVARNLIQSLFAREEEQRRAAALVQLGHQLIGVADRAEIRKIAGECAGAICEATSGLRLLVVVVIDGRAVVVEAAGEMREVPRDVPTSVLPTPGSGIAPLSDVATLVAPTGVPTWLGLALGDEAERWWMLVGAPSRVPADAVVAIRAMANQVALALLNSDAHHDLATQASQDALTGLLNRAAFSAALDAAIVDPGRQAALLFLDLDDFKIVNDGMGHSAGDELLRQVAVRMRGGVRPGDLCARIGGDEFAVLLGDTEDAAAVGQRLVELIAAPVSLNGRMARVGASVGLAFATPADVTGENLVQRADIAMYAAKAKGKNRVQTFDPALLQGNGRAQFEADLAAAAAADQLIVHYQPIVLVADGRCVAVEALVRWRHPTRGLLYPAEFIPTAERTGAIVDIGAHVMRQACADVAAWSGSSGPLAVHVNVSVAQLTQPDIVETVRNCLTDHEMEPRRLVLEITESMVLDSPAVRTRLVAVAELGVAIAIDDFGTGYSALSTLRSLPLDIVKIDKSFLEGGPTRAADEAVVEAIVQMADRLGLSVVAEGVERLDQQQFLRRVGAYAAQGFLYLRPASARDFAEWLDEQETPRSASIAVVTPINRRHADTPESGAANVPHLTHRRHYE